MQHEEYKEMLAFHALGALDDLSRRALEEHLENCDECRAELNGWRETIGALAYSIAPVKPSPELRTRLLENLRLQMPRTDERTETENNNGSTPAPTSANVIPFQTHAPRRLYGNTALMLGAIAASLAIIALSISLVVLLNRNRELQAQLSQLSTSLHTTQQELARAHDERELLAAPDAHTAALAGTPKAKSARARLVYDERTGQAILFADALPPAPAGKAYQLWFIADGKPLPGGVFQTTAGGHAELRDTVPPAGRHASIFAVTLEPQGGVSAPTGEMYLKSSAS